MPYVQYPMLVALLVVAIMYYLRLDKLDHRLHVRRLVRLHRALGLFTLAGVGITCPPLVAGWGVLVVTLPTLVLPAYYLILTRNDWKAGHVPEYATTGPSALDHFLNG